MLLAGGSMPIALPLLAQTQIGDQIKNTFTGTFKDAAGVEQTATSNEVVLAISEVAGLTVKADTPSKANPDPNDKVWVDFVITNVGNDTTSVFIPGQAKVSDPPNKTGSASFTQGTLQVIEFAGTALPTPINVPAAGENSGNFATPLPNAGVLAPGQTIKVRVPFDVKNTALKNDSMIVTLGNTGASAVQQNIPYTADPGSVYTIDPANGTAGEAAGVPANGQREAMDTSSLFTVGVRLQAFGTVLLAREYNNGNTPGVLTDDRITYNIAARAEKTLPTGVVDVVPTDLCMTKVNLAGAPVDRVLVADAIPTDTILSAPAPIASTDGVWQVVYTTSPLALPANEADWNINRPADSASITRVGYLSETCLPVGKTASGFSFVVEPKPGYTGGAIVNIAQLFGQSLPGAPVTATPTQIVYDESGDQDPNNGLGDANPDPKSGGAAENSGGIMARAADLALDGIDPGRGISPIATDTNQGVNTAASNGSKPAGGESVGQVIAAAPTNGPQAQANAIGPKDTEDDFTNVILAPPAAIPATQKLDDAQTPPVKFTNTVQSGSALAQDVSLLPQAPALKTALPDGTTVTIANTLNTQSAIYTYTAANGFTFLSGIGGPTAVLGVVVQLTPGAGNKADYTVTVDLPNAEQIKEYPVPILAYVDQGKPGYDFGDPANLTIDRIYTGFIRVVKEARVIDTNGTTEVVAFTTDTTALGKAIEIDRFVEYRLTYTNVSIAQGGGTNNVVLPATAFTILDDGAALPNNWFTTTLDPAFPTQPTGSATTTSQGKITVTTANNDIQAYKLTVPSLNPGDTGTLTFRRKIRQP
jgi:hypothetical protein